MKDNKILFFVNSLSGGGAERVCLNLAQEYISRGIKVEFITIYNDDNYELPVGIERISIGLSSGDSKIIKIYGLIKGVILVNKYTANKSYTLVTSHLPFSNLLTVLTRCGKRSLYVCHTNVRDDLPKKFPNVTIWVIKKLLKNKKIVTVSKELGESLPKRYGFDSQKITTIYNPLVYNNMREMMLEPLKFKRPYILFIGRLENQKRVDRAIKNYYNGKFKDRYDLVILGEGSLYSDTLKLINELELTEYVKMMGWESNSYKWMYNAELLLMTSDYEAFPMVLIEALACNCPIVSGDFDFGPGEILRGKQEKYLVKDYQSETAYIEKINLCINLNEKSDATELLDECNLKKIADDYLDTYQI